MVNQQHGQLLIAEKEKGQHRRCRGKLSYLRLSLGHLGGLCIFGTLLEKFFSCCCCCFTQQLGSGFQLQQECKVCPAYVVRSPVFKWHADGTGFVSAAVIVLPQSGRSSRKFSMSIRGTHPKLKTLNPKPQAPSDCGDTFCSFGL